MMIPTDIATTPTTPAITAVLWEALLLPVFEFELDCAEELAAGDTTGQMRMASPTTVVRVTKEDQSRFEYRKIVPGEEEVEPAPSSWVRMNESIFRPAPSVALVLVTVRVYVSVGSILSLLKRIICAWAPATRYESDSTDVALPCQAWRVIGTSAGGDISLIPYPT